MSGYLPQSNRRLTAGINDAINPSRSSVRDAIVHPGRALSMMAVQGAKHSDDGGAGRELSDDCAGRATRSSPYRRLAPLRVARGCVVAAVRVFLQGSSERVASARRAQARLIDVILRRECRPRGFRTSGGARWLVRLSGYLPQSNRRHTARINDVVGFGGDR
jgi:hypothetical protein